MLRVVVKGGKVLAASAVYRVAPPPPPAIGYAALAVVPAAGGFVTLVPLEDLECVTEETTVFPRQVAQHLQYERFIVPTLDSHWHLSVPPQDSPEPAALPDGGVPAAGVEDSVLEAARSSWKDLYSRAHGA